MKSEKKDKLRILSLIKKLKERGHTEKGSREVIRNKTFSRERIRKSQWLISLLLCTSKTWIMQFRVKEMTVIWRDLMVSCKTLLYIFPWLPLKLLLSSFPLHLLYRKMYLLLARTPNNAGISPWDVYWAIDYQFQWLNRWFGDSLLPTSSCRCPALPLSILGVLFSDSVCHFIIMQDTEAWTTFSDVTLKTKVRHKKWKANDYW